MADSNIVIPSLTVTTGIGQLIAEWAPGVDSTEFSGLTGMQLAAYEVWVSSTNNRGSATKVGETIATQYAIKGLSASTTRYVWVRARDKSGNHGDFYPLSATGGISATTSTILPPDNSITGAMLQNNIIQASHIQANAINANHIQANAITAVKLAANSVTADKINVANLAAISATLGNVTVNGSLIVNGTLTTAKYGAQSIVNIGYGVDTGDYAFGTGEQTAASVSLSTAGGRCAVMAVLCVEHNGSDTTVRLAIKKNGSTQVDEAVATVLNGKYASGTLLWVDNSPGTTTATYSAHIRTTATTAKHIFSAIRVENDKNA